MGAKHTKSLVIIHLLYLRPVIIHILYLRPAIIHILIFTHCNNTYFNIYTLLSFLFKNEWGKYKPSISSKSSKRHENMFIQLTDLSYCSILLCTFYTITRSKFNVPPKKGFQLICAWNPVPQNILPLRIRIRKYKNMWIYNHKCSQHSVLCNSLF